MPEITIRPLGPHPKLHKILENYPPVGESQNINLYDRVREIKEAAKDFLDGYDKNGFEHSQRLEGYLDMLTAGLRERDMLSPAEIFVLLCAVYTHDLGYMLDGELEARDHPQRSRERILNDPAKYFLGDFPALGGNTPRAAEAVAIVAEGHSEEQFLALNMVESNFPDSGLGDEPLNLRKLAALLRMADEADDPYIRPKAGTGSSIRDRTPLVSIGSETIRWHWKHSDTAEPGEFVEHLNEKQKILVTSIDYLREIGAGNWYLVLDPQVAGTIPFMAARPVETFVGRKPDLEKLHDIIKNRRAGAITGVTGTGGIGKTELARMYAEKYRHDYPGGVFWASMKGSDWKAEAEKIFAELRPGAEPMVFPDKDKAGDEVRKFLDREGALLIIDNVNQGDEIIKPKCSVLVTTRNRDAFKVMPYGSIYSLQGFDEDEGLDLLKEILGPDRVERDQLGAAQLIKILGGMPLAVEIAARHLSDSLDTGFPEYIGRVQGRVELLNIKEDPDKDVIATLTLSLDALADEEDGEILLALFEAISVCVETGLKSETLGSAAGYKDMDRMVLGPLVGKLHQRSLLEFIKESSRYVSHPLVHQIAESRLKADEEREKEFRQNHCQYFLDFANAYGHNPQDLIEEKDGLWQAMVQTIQTGWQDEKLPLFLKYLSRPYWEYIKAEEYQTAFNYLVAVNFINIDELGQSRELVEILTSLYQNQSGLDDNSRASMLNSLGIAYYNQGEYSQAIKAYEQALEIDRRTGNIRGEGADLGNMGVAYSDLGEYRRAIGFHEQALEVQRRIGDVGGEGKSLGSMGTDYMRLGEYRKAIELHEQALEIHRRIGDIRDEESALGNMGVAYSHLGEYGRAIELYEQALEIARRIGDIRGEANALGSMGLAYFDLGEYRRAIEFYEQALEIDRGIGDVRGEGNALGNMGTAYGQLGEYRRAIGFFEQQLEITRKIGDIRGEGSALGNMGIAYKNLGEHRRAIGFYEQQLEITRQIGDILGEGNALNNMGIAYAQMGQKEKAREYLEAARSIYERMELEHMVRQTEENLEILGLKS